MKFLQLGIFACLCIGLSQSVPLFPKGRRWEYAYGASANIGTQTPTYAATGMKLKGKVIIESFSSKVVLMKFVDMQSMHHNGGVEYLKGKGAPLPEEAKVIETPFLVHYSDSTIDHIFVEPNEPTWAVNMKKAIAGVFQLELEKMTDEAFYATETNIYGKCDDVEYNVVNNTESYQVTKMFKFDKCQSPEKVFSTATPFTCSNEKATIASATREYTIKKDYIYPLITNISTLSEKFVDGFYNAEGSYKMTSRQIVTFIQDTKLPEDHSIPDSCNVKADLVYQQTPHFELTHGRKPISQDEVIALIKELATKVIHRFEDKFVLDPVVLHQNTMQHMFWLMHSLNKEGFEKLFKEVSTSESCEDDMRRNMILEILPQVGTYESLMFMKEYMDKGKFDEYIYMKMLAQYPFYVKDMSEKLLSEFESLTTATPSLFAETFGVYYVPNTAILSFSNLVYRTYLHNKCSTEVFEKYVSQYFKHFKEGKTYEDKLIYLQGLRNMQFGTVFSKMIDIIKNKDNSRHLRFQATWGLMPDAQKHPHEMYKLFWPILTNRKEHLEMRAMALKMLLLSEPTPARFFSIYWYMKSERSTQLYNLYYSIIYNMKYSTYSCFEKFEDLCDKFLKYIKEPVESKFEKFTSVILADYLDSEAKLGGLLHGFTIGEDYADMPNVGYFTTAKFGFGSTFERVGLFFKINGLDELLFGSEVPNEVNSSKDILKMIQKANLKIRPSYPLHLEFFIDVHNKIVFSKVWNKENFEQEYPIIKEQVVDKVTKCGNSLNSQYITPSMMTNWFGTTDFGTFSHIGLVKNAMSTIRSNESVIFKHDSMGVKGDMRYGNIEFFEQRMDYFNPLSNIYQGLAKMKSSQTGWAAKMAVKFNLGTELVNLQWENSESNNGFVMHQQTVTYTATQDDILRNKAEKSKEFSVKPVSTHRRKKPLNQEWSFPLKHLGVKFVLNVFDYDQNHKYTDYFDVIKGYVEKFMEEFDEAVDVEDVFLALSTPYDLLEYNIPEGNIGVAIRVFPLLEEPANLQIDIGESNYKKIEFNDILKDQFKLNDTELYLAVRLNKASEPDKVYYWWNTTMGMEFDYGLLQTFNMKFSQRDFGEEKPTSICLNYKMDYDGGDCKHPKADFYDLEPIKPAVMKLHLAWGDPKPDICPVDHSINIVYKGSITDEQIEASKKSTEWPFKQCKKLLGTTKFNTASEACYRAAIEMSTYRKYDTSVQIVNGPEWFEMAYNFYEFFTAFSDEIPNFNVEFVNGSTKFKFTEVFKMDDEETVEFTNDKGTQKVEMSPTMLLELTNPKLERAETLFEDTGVCIISPDRITTYANETIENYDRKDKYILLTQCNEYPAYVVFMNYAEDVGTKYHIVTQEGHIDIIAKEDNFEFTVYNNKLDIKQKVDTDSYMLEKHHDGYYLELKSQNIEFTFRPDFTVLTTPEDDTCGLCNLQYSDVDEYTDYVYSKHQ